MKVKNKVIWVALVAILVLVLTGCSQNVVFLYSMKMQNVQSMQEHTTMTFQLSGSGFEPAVQQQVDTAAMFLNNAKLDLDAKTNRNEEKTANKSQVDMNLALQGTNINMSAWVDSDLTGNKPKVTEIVKLPQLAAMSLPAQFASKEYMVMNPLDMNNSALDNSALDNINMTKFMEFSKSLQAKEFDFLMSYSQQFDPDVNLIYKGIQTVPTHDGQKQADIYEIKLNDAQFKELIRYTVNNFVQNKDAMYFVKEYMDSTLEFSQAPDKDKTLSEFNQAFIELDINKPQFLAKFNAFMDQLNDVTLLGDKGLDLQYAISGGYLIKKSGTINLKFDAARLDQFMNRINGQHNTSADAKGTLNLMLNFNTDIFGINSPLDIQLPEVNSNNSFNYMDLINSSKPSNDKSLTTTLLKSYRRAASV